MLFTKLTAGWSFDHELQFESLHDPQDICVAVCPPSSVKLRPAAVPPSSPRSQAPFCTSTTQCARRCVACWHLLPIHRVHFPAYTSNSVDLIITSLLSRLYFIRRAIDYETETQPALHTADYSITVPIKSFMNLTLAAVHAPHLHTPFQRSDQYDIVGRVSPELATGSGALRLSDTLTLLPHSNPARWSLDSHRNKGKAEEAQMSSYGSASQKPHDDDRERANDRLDRSSREHVLPPIINPSASLKMHRQDKKSPHLSPDVSTVERSDPGSERRGPRLLGVRSILNPSHGEDEQPSSQRRGTSESMNERRASFAMPAGLLGPQPAQAPPRRILTPISPRLHRAASYGRITGTIDATERPFLSDGSRNPTPEHTAPTTASHLPQHPPHVTQHSPFIMPTAPTPPLPPGQRRASVSIVGSTRPSPSPSYADSYSQSGMSGQTSPSMHPVPGLQPGPTPLGSMRLTPSPSLGPINAVPSGSLDSEQGFHGPVVSSGQNYQILTVDTSKGHMQLPVEVQAASRMADEKRKRNAGASARFRARRKEKEREAASKISNLELELTYAQEDSRHYRAERDFLADIIARYVPQYESHLKNRPPSPRHKRAHHIPHRAPLSSADSPISTVDSEQYDDEPPTARRRTEGYQFPNAAGAEQQYPASPYNTYAPAHPQLPAPQHHGSSQYGQQSTHAPPPILSRPPGPHDHHRSEHAYDRTWPRSSRSDHAR